MKTLVATMLLVTAVLARPPIVCAEGAVAEISGTVKDPSGAAVPGASVTLRDSNGAPLQVTVTDTGGRYSFPRPQPGGYTLFVFKEGFTRPRKSFASMTAPRCGTSS